MVESLIGMFAKRAQEQDAEVLTVQSGVVPDAIRDIARESGLATFSVSEGLDVELREVLRGAGGLAEVELAAGIAVTGAAWAVAETGSLLIKGSRRQFITAEVHVAIVDASSVLNGLDDVPFGLETAPSVTLVTGPSRTADIERVLVLGAHGPGRLVVLIVKP